MRRSVSGNRESVSNSEAGLFSRYVMGGALVVALAGGVWSLASGSATKRAPNTGAVSSSQPPSDPRVTDELERQRALLASLSHRVGRVEGDALERRDVHSAIGERTPDDVAPESVPTHPSDVRPDPSKPPRYTQRDIDELDSVLASDGWDAKWSPTALDTIQGAMQRASAAAKSADPAKCGASFCRVRVVHANVADRSPYQTALRGTRMGGLTIHTQTAEGDSVSTTYFVRPDQDTPDHPVRRVGSGSRNADSVE